MKKPIPPLIWLRRSVLGLLAVIMTSAGAAAQEEASLRQALESQQQTTQALIRAAAVITANASGEMQDRKSGRSPRSL